MPDGRVKRLAAAAPNFVSVKFDFHTGAIRGVVEIGTQTSLVRRASGSFVLLDAYTLKGAVKERVFALTDGGRAIEAVLHLHPFHTIHVRPVAELLPHAVHFGSVRHRARAVVQGSWTLVDGLAKPLKSVFIHLLTSI